MTLTIVALNNNEEFLAFIDPELCTLTETIEYGGLRTLSLNYKFQNLLEDKEYFRVGNKIWVQGDNNIQDCLYVINTEVEQDIYENNTFTCELEEVLVELNYAPIFSQTQLTSAVDEDDNPIFRLVTSNGKQEVYVDWNALNYWFGAYFNIGIVQKCLSDYASRISITGTINLMNLLRQIEEETGNVFVTRYEKDTLTNTIHRYLDFLNPINADKDWMFNIEYNFLYIEESKCYDQDGNLTTEDQGEQVTRFHNTAYDEEAIDEDTDTSHEEDYDVEVTEPYDEESNVQYDYEKSPTYPILKNINSENCEFRICNENLQLLNTDGRIWQTGDTALSWNCNDTGLVDDGYKTYAITLQKSGSELGVSVNEKDYCVAGIGDRQTPFISELRDEGSISIAQDDERAYSMLPDNSYFTIYDTVNNKFVFTTQLNLEIGTVHEEILDFGRNLENIVYNIDETDTYTAISPIIQVNDEGSTGKELSRTDMDTIINRWLNLSISKGDIVPMIVEKINKTGTSWQNAASTFGTYSVNGNYYIRPLKPTDNTDSTDKQFEFYRGVAYWKAPYTKNAGEMYVRTDKSQNISYTDIYIRPDIREERAGSQSPKTGNTETSDEDVYAIYNQVCQYLKEHETPNVDLQLDVANLIGYEYNNYDLHDKIYIKLPNTRELITTRITKTEKEAHDVAKNTIEISNYKAVNTVKTITHETYIEAGNSQFTYPATKTLSARLVNTSPDADTDTYPGNKLITFTLYSLENESRTLTGKVYTKLTDANGYATIAMDYLPGDYELDIQFAGDEEYEESQITVTVNVDGVYEIPVEETKKKVKTGKVVNKTKTVKKAKYKTVTTYYDKYGRSPDKKKILAIGKRSAGKDPNKGGFWETEFKNKCPHCGKASLYWSIFWAGNETSNWGKFPATGKREGGSAEGTIFCKSCDADYSIFGNEHDKPWTKLKVTKKTAKSSKTKAYTLKKGKRKYGTKKIKITNKKVENKVTRKIRAKGISKKVKDQALAIAKNKTGLECAKTIVSWIDKHIKYDKYYNFVHSASSVLDRRKGNCCDVTRLCFEMLDAAGCCEYFKLEYIWVDGHVYGRVTTKKTGKSRTVDCASDWHAAWGYICMDYRNKGVINRTTYPKKPF